MKLMIVISDGKMEQSTFRTRSLRKVIFASCCATLIVVSLHTVGHQRHSQYQTEQDHMHSSRTECLPWYTRAGYVQAQVPIYDEETSLHGSRPSLDGHMRTLPDVIRISFEEAVKDVQLQGWEDEWLSSARYGSDRYGTLEEPKLDFVYNWVNGSDADFIDIKHRYELASPLNRPDGTWISQHSVNRYRDWDELKYSFRSLEKHAKPVINKIQLLVNSVYNRTNTDPNALRPQRPIWLKNDPETRHNVEVLAQEDFFGDAEKKCLPSFDSVSIETQIHMTPSNVDQLVALSDDMFLGAPHSAADFYSPLFGSMMAFKPDHYNVKTIKTADIPTFGEKPYLYYTSSLLNHRFGERDRKVQAHFSHSVSRRVMKEALSSFPGPAMRGACERFRGESKFQLYPWYAAFHYSIERFREALLWSFITTRADINGDGYLDWTERENILKSIKHGRDLFATGDSSTPVPPSGRDRLFYQLPTIQQQAGLQPPLSNVAVLWTSLDGPETIRTVKCHNFQTNVCFAEGFESSLSDALYSNPEFSTTNIFTQLSKHEPRCGDCLIKFILSNTSRGLESLLPPKVKIREREIIIKALTKYQHTVIEPDAKFVMVKDAEQANHEIMERTIKLNKHVGQWCLNDDVMTEDEKVVSKVNDVIQNVFKTQFPAKGRWEAD